jgi:hypothetical protein
MSHRLRPSTVVTSDSSVFRYSFPGATLCLIYMYGSMGRFLCWGLTLPVLCYSC